MSFSIYRELFYVNVKVPLSACLGSVSLFFFKLVQRILFQATFNCNHVQLLEIYLFLLLVTGHNENIGPFPSALNIWCHVA